MKDKIPHNEALKLMKNIADYNLNLYEIRHGFSGSLMVSYHDEYPFAITTRLFIPHKEETFDIKTSISDPPLEPIAGYILDRISTRIRSGYHQWVKSVRKEYPEYENEINQAYKSFVRPMLKRLIKDLDHNMIDLYNKYR